jgi:hypothetical protein
VAQFHWVASVQGEFVAESTLCTKAPFCQVG